MALGPAVYSRGVGLGGAEVRIALTGAAYAVAAALFVPSRWVRSAGLGAPAVAVAYGGFAGPAQAREREHAAQVARYRDHPELLYLGAAPPGMVHARATVGPASFGVDYRAARPDETAYVGLAVRPALTPVPRCPEPAEKGVACAVDARGEMRTVRGLPGGVRAVTLTRRLGPASSAEAEVSSQTLGEHVRDRVLETPPRMHGWTPRRCVRSSGRPSSGRCGRPPTSWA
ncbi:hypothetical protein [Streptomyces sp. NPDC003717]|uniref:hypothetical protein n=1 Tax=Streptomyces sp. NPDC003717 TaxID=3154276 RepID=UPI0033A30F45